MRSIFITGAASGLGARTARKFADEGWVVFGADRDELPEDLRTRGVTGFVVDVTDDASVAAAMDEVARLTGGTLDAVAAFAGALGIGALTDIPGDRMTAILDLNVTGQARVHRAALPLLMAARREGRSPRVLVISSETGRQQAMPTNGLYAMSKHAVDAYGDALRRELALLGIGVTIIEPGPFRTNMTKGIRQAFIDATPEGSPFADLMAVAGESAARTDGKAADPALLADAVFDAAVAAKPPIRVKVAHHRGRALLDLLPPALGDKLIVGGLKRAIAKRARGR